MISLSGSMRLTLITGSSSGFFFFRFLPRGFFPVSASIRARSSSFFFCSSRRAWPFPACRDAFFGPSSAAHCETFVTAFWRRISAEEQGFYHRGRILPIDGLSLPIDPATVAFVGGKSRIGFHLRSIDDLDARIDESDVLDLFECVHKQSRQSVFIVFPEPIDRTVVRMIGRNDRPVSDRVFEEPFDLSGGYHASKRRRGENHLARIKWSPAHVVGTIAVDDRRKILVRQNAPEKEVQIIFVKKTVKIPVEKRKERFVCSPEFCFQAFLLVEGMKTTIQKGYFKEFKNEINIRYCK